MQIYSAVNNLYPVINQTIFLFLYATEGEALGKHSLTVYNTITWNIIGIWIFVKRIADGPCIIRIAAHRCNLTVCCKPETRNFANSITPNRQTGST